VGDCTGVAMATSEGKCHGKYHSLRGGISRCHFKGKKSKKKRIRIKFNKGTGKLNGKLKG
jgi:hypothetical protein